MKQENIVAADRTTVSPALVRAEATGAPAAAMELPDGRVITGKTGDLLGSSAALLLNALKSSPASTMTYMFSHRNPSLRSRP